MKALLTFGRDAGNEARVGVQERETVVHFQGFAEFGVTDIDLSQAVRKLSFYLKNEADEDPTNSVFLNAELLDGSGAVIQRQIFYAERSYIIPVPLVAQKLRITNPFDLPIPVTIAVF